MAVKVTIVILNWNNAPDTLACLDSVRQIRYPCTAVILVDNGSRDGSGAIIADRFPDVPMIRIPDNCGFCRANNIGIAQALRDGAEYVMLLNNDAIVDPRIVDAFLHAARELPDAGFLGGKVFYYSAPQTIWYGYTIWDQESLWFRNVAHNAIDNGQPELNTLRETAYVNGCVLFFSRKVAETVGLLDTRFFCYIDEIDWCTTAREEGFRNYYVPAAMAWHKVSTVYGGVSSPGVGAASPIKEYFRTRNRLLWARKHLGFRQRLTVLRRLLQEIVPPAVWTAAGVCGAPRRLYWSILTAWRTPAARGKLCGIGDYLLGRFGDCPEKTKSRLGFATTDRRGPNPLPASDAT